MTKKKGIDIIGVPSTFGQRKLGVDLGPTAIRYAGLIPRLKQLDLDVNDKGDIKVSAVDIEKFQSEQKGIDIIGVPSTFGQRKLGVDLGPTA
ncbi:arginase family protein, partial [Staphylococcus aureus]|uniref:arginase family protein n=1 Tax=Staphylococcus aureus TaxID=1280 RepID=UPI001EF18C4A